MLDVLIAPDSVQTSSYNIIFQQFIENEVKSCKFNLIWESGFQDSLVYNITFTRDHDYSDVYYLKIFVNGHQVWARKLCIETYVLPAPVHSLH